MQEIAESIRILYEQAFEEGITGSGLGLACHHGVHWVPGKGLVAKLYLYDPHTYKGQSTTIQLLPGDNLDLGRAAESLEKLGRAAAHLKPAPLAEQLGLPEVRFTADDFLPQDSDRSRRQECLGRMRQRFPLVEERFRSIYGLRLPRQLAVFAALLDSLTPLEHSGLSEIGRAPQGLTRWFRDGALERRPRDDLDPRLDARYRCDPPEFITVLSGDSDGLHYGLWYDDPAYPPSFLVHNWARDSGETIRDDEPTLCLLLRERIRELQEEDEVSFAALALDVALQDFSLADAAAQREDGSPWSDAPRVGICGGLGVAVPTELELPGGDRYPAYQTRDPQVKDWIAKALSRAEEGDAGWALTLGRELHWFDSDDYRPDSLRLLTTAYRALDREALAAIAELHHRHRDLRNVDVLR